jgi:hypothetical protein
MADNIVSEMFLASVFNRILGEKENGCECCEIMFPELNELKLELSSCKEIIRVFSGRNAGI